jgi:hypothetical protein
MHEKQRALAKNCPRSVWLNPKILILLTTVG